VGREAGKAMEPIKVMIVDDHPVVRDGISAMLAREADVKVVGDARNGLEAIERARQLQPDVILMDLRMPEMDGATAMKRIRAENASVKFLVLTTYDSDEHIFQAIEAGAKGYLLKDSSRDDLFHAVRAVHRGESLIHPAVAARVLDRFAQMARQGTGGETISDREIEVLTLMAKGAANKEIADALAISESTVKTHVGSLFRKLEANDRTEAVTKALQRGIIKL
jgi:DNA-binding NarL/FixJ family response regulator